MSEKRLPLIIWGASGHALVVAEVARLTGLYEVVAFVDDVNPHRKDQLFHGVRVIGSLTDLQAIFVAGVKHLIVGFGNCHQRLIVSSTATEIGFELATLVHPTAVVSSEVTIGPGTVVMAGSIVNPFAIIADNVIINTGSIIEHECSLASGVHISPGAQLGGQVVVGRSSWVGIGATVKDKVKIGRNSIVGAGAVVVNDVQDHVVVAGVPAKFMRMNKGSE